MFKRRYVCALVVFLSLIYLSQEVGWRQDRRPKIMGEKIPMKSILPFRRKVQRKIVVYHNYFRTRVFPRASNMLRMQWHREAAKSAQKWAYQCMFLTHDNITGRHIDDYGSCGQNIFISSHLVPWLFAIKTWYLEKDNFTYGSPKNDLKVVGHYTQMVWGTTHEVGCGLAKCHKNGEVKGKTYFNYVCNYCPIGNRESRLGFPYKKGKPCRQCRNTCHMRKLCTNSCPVADHWANCRELHNVWPQWLCHTETEKGKSRKSFCKATCTCQGKLHD